MTLKTGKTRGRPPDAGAGYRRLAAELLGAIEAGRFPPGSLLPSTRTLQREYGVGYRTVWLAVDRLKREGRLAPAPGRRLAVLTAGARGASVLNPLLVIVGHGNLTSVLRNTTSRALLRGVGMGAGEVDAPLLTVHQKPLQGRMPEGLAGLDPRGVILFGHFKRPLLGSYARLGVPAVLLDWPNPVWKGHSLHVDNVAAAGDAVKRLAALGHRHIAFAQQVSLVQSDLDLDARERAAGFARGLKAAGLASRRETVFTFLPPKQGESPALKRLLSARPAFTAVLTAGQRQALTIIDAARAAGRSVPGELSVASFQPMEGALRAGLSGPCVDFEAMGREAVKLLEFSARPAQQRRFPATWREGKTIATPPPPRRTTSL